MVFNLHLQIQNTLNNMKKSLIFSAIFIFVMPNLYAQNKTNIRHVIFLDGQFVMEGKMLIYQLKDSTIQIIPYQYRKIFNKKTPDELAVLSWQMQDGHLEIPVQEYSIEMLDVIKVRSRQARGRNMLIGMGIGVVASIVYVQHRKKFDEEFSENDYWDWTRVFLPPVFVGVGAIAGMSIPTLEKQFRIGKSRKGYEKEKAMLGQYAILK